MCDDGCDLSTWQYNAEKRMNDGLYLDALDVKYYLFIVIVLVIGWFIIGLFSGFAMGEAKAYKDFMERKIEIPEIKSDVTTPRIEKSP